jgi:nucleoside-diphosphate-sugar epimerase
MRVLIIGGTGNISTATTRILVGRGDDVTLCNRGRTQVEIPGEYRTILGDRRDHASFEAQMATEVPFDCVIDMICYEPQDAQSVVRAFRGRTGQLIFCSTTDVYTKPATHYPVGEDAERKPSPAFPYAYKKAICENTLLRAQERGDFALTIIRPAQTYSDFRTPISLIGSGPGFLKRVRDGKPIIILGNGTSFWVATHRDDVGAAFAGAVGNAQALGKAYNVTGEEWMTWEQYYGTVAEVMGAPALDLVCIPTDVLARMAPRSSEWCVVNFHFNNIFDNSSAMADLGYRYTIPWAEGVRRLVAWHDERGLIDGSPGDPLYDRIVSAWRRVGERAERELAGADV